MRRRRPRGAPRSWRRCGMGRERSRITSPRTQSTAWSNVGSAPSPARASRRAPSAARASLQQLDQRRQGRGCRVAVRVADGQARAPRSPILFSARRRPRAHRYSADHAGAISASAAQSTRPSRSRATRRSRAAAGRGAVEERQRAPSSTRRSSRGAPPPPRGSPATLREVVSSPTAPPASKGAAAKLFWEAARQLGARLGAAGGARGASRLSPRSSRRARASPCLPRPKTRARGATRPFRRRASSRVSRTRPKEVHQGPRRRMRRQLPPTVRPHTVDPDAAGARPESTRLRRGARHLFRPPRRRCRGGLPRRTRAEQRHISQKPNTGKTLVRMRRSMMPR